MVVEEQFAQPLAKDSNQLMTAGETSVRERFAIYPNQLKIYIYIYIYNIHVIYIKQTKNMVTELWAP